MSTVPPNLVGPILQSPLLQRQVAGAREIERGQEFTAQRQHTTAIDEGDATVETTDGDTQIHSDAEGAGSQGRPFSEAEPEPELKETASETRPDGTGQILDLEA